MSQIELDAQGSALQSRLPKPAAVQAMIFKNRRERCLLRQLLKLSEQVHTVESASSKEQADGQ